jgi:hypothetical protein
MSPSEIRDALVAVPFEPFRLVVSGGNHYDVDDPHFVFVTNRFVHICIPVAPGDRFPDRYVRVDMLRITELVPRTQPPQEQGNSQPAG